MAAFSFAASIHPAPADEPVGASWAQPISTHSAADVPLAHPLSESRFLSSIRQLTYDGLRSGEGYFSPDGQNLIFQSEREFGNPFYQIYILNLLDGRTHRVSPGMGKTTCGFFRPGSDQVLFASTHHDPASATLQKAELDFRASGKHRRYAWDYDEQMEIYSASRGGSNPRRLTDSPGYDAEAAYSPDGRRIVFSSLRHGYPKSALDAEQQMRLETDPSWFAEIYIMNADGSAPKRLTYTPGYDGGPFFSPDGRRIVWRRFDASGANADIFTMKTEGSDERRLTDFQAMSWAPYYHPSGRYIIFASNKFGFSNFELFLVDSAGARSPVRVTTADGFDGLPVFSPDGKSLCWTSARTADSKSQLFLGNWDHAAALKVLGSAPARAVPTTQAATPAAAARPASARGGGDLAEPVAAAKESEQRIHVTRALPRFRARLTPDVTEQDLLEQVSFLASDAMDGRAAGTEGARQAGKHIADIFQKAGLKPVSGTTSWLQPFHFTSGVRLVPNSNRLEWIASSNNAATHSATLDQDFRPLGLSASGLAEGEVVFAGYGLKMPGKPGEDYDSYSGLAVSNKIVLVLRYAPEGASAERRQELNRYAGLRYKAMIARENGARAILIVTGPNSPSPGELIPVAFDSSSSGSGILAATLSGRVADEIFKTAGKDLKAIQSELDTESPHAERAFPLAGIRVRLNLGVEQIKAADANVLGLIPAHPASPHRSEYILIGAHYDHLGRGKEGSLQHAGEENQIHNGADDNASGTAAVLELAAALAHQHKKRAPQRGILFALWSAEEIGLLGSAHFAENPPMPLSNIVACINFDMVGRLRENRLVMQGVGSSGQWRSMLERNNVGSGFQLVLQDDPYLPTDVTSFYPKGVPVLNFFTGGHADYHRPTDDSDKLDFPGLERISRFAQRLISDLAASDPRPAYAKVERSSVAGGSRDSLRAYLGTIPDYATETTGVKLSGVRGGSPAEKAGIQGGDVIVEFAGKTIANIYDYTYSLDAVRIGVPADLTVLRNGQRVKISVTPEARR